MWAATAYAGPVREALVAFKDHGRWSLRSRLGALLAVAVAGLVLDSGCSEITLVPVPSSARARSARDGDHVGELGRSAARHLRRAGLGVHVTPGLEAIARRRDQVGLGHADRARNIHETLCATGDLVGLPGIVVIDDLVTTGATLAEGCRALRVAGFTPLGAAVVAATQRRRPGLTAHRPAPLAFG